MPPGLSINARIIPVEIDRKNLDLTAITALQDNGERLRHAMRGYIEWLQGQYRELKSNLPRAREIAKMALSGRGIDECAPAARNSTAAT